MPKTLRLPSWVKPGYKLAPCPSCGGVAAWRELSPGRWLGACLEEDDAPGLERPCWWGGEAPQVPEQHSA